MVKTSLITWDSNFTFSSVSVIPLFVPIQGYFDINVRRSV